MDGLKQWFDGEVFLRQEELVFRDCDAQGRARTGALLSIMAAMGGHDYDARDLTYERLFELRQVFLLSRISMKVHAQPMVGEVLTVGTWEDGVKAAHMRRNYQLTRQDGTLCVSGRSEWILVDPVERRILRPSEFTGKELTSSSRTLDCPECRKLLLPKEGVQEIGTREIRYSDLDHNGHLFSGNYGDIVWDALSQELQTAPIRTFSINYSKEVTQGDCLKLFGVRQDRRYWMEGVGPSGPCFTCVCEFGE